MPVVSAIACPGEMLLKITPFVSYQVIVTSAVGAQLGADVSGARIVRVLDNEIHHQYYAIEDLPETVEL